MIYLISGSGIGAGKTYLAKKLSLWVHSMADGIRCDLSGVYPDYHWYSKKQRDKLVVCRETGKTLREMMVEYGQSKCVENPAYWAERLWGTLEWKLENKVTVAVDDVRKMVELNYFKDKLKDECVHFHVQWGGAIHEEQYDNDRLEQVADYIIRRQK